MHRPHKTSRRAAHGFTLVELIVVMAVLTVLAGLVLPKLDVFKLKANKAAAASNIHGVDRFVASYKVLHDLFPDRWDSLLDDTAAGLFTSLDPQLTGSLPGNPVKLALTTIVDDSELRSLNRVGITTVFDHALGGFPADSGTVGPRLLQVGDTLATINAADPDGADIIQHLYPVEGAVPSGKKIVVFGLGPGNEMNGDILHAPPFYANTDQVSFYSRFLVAFELDSGGSRAELLGALGADGDTLGAEIADFYE